MKTADNSPAIALTGEHKNAIQEAILRAPKGPALFDLEHEPDVRVFVANFDGTNNDAQNLDPQYRQTLVATNHEKLRDASPQVLSKYYAGVGTRRSLIGGLFESVTGSGCADRAEAALDDLEMAVAAWQKENPDVRVFVHAVGFSRGAASALHFLNLVHDRNEFVQIGPHPHANDRPMATIASTGVLLDTVATGQTSQLSLTVPSSVASLLHVTAGGEERLLFPLLDISHPKRPSDLVLIAQDSDATPVAHKRTHSVEIPGARHSDVGGSYREGGLGHVSEYLMATYQTSLGLTMHAHRPSFAEIQGMFAHDSRFVRADLDQEDRQRATRERRVIPVETMHDCGRSELVGIEVVESIASSKVAAKSVMNFLPPKIGHKDPTIAKYPGLGMTLGINFMHSETAPEGVSYICDATDSFSIHRGRVLCLGESVAGVPSVTEIRDLLRSSECVRITVTREALIPPVNLRPDFDRPQARTWLALPSVVQKPEPNASTTQDTPKRKQGTSKDWPIALEDLVQRLNATPGASYEVLQKSLVHAMEIAAFDLAQSFPEVTSVKYSFDARGIKIVCNRPDGPFSNRSTSSDLNECVLLQRLLTLSPGVDAVASKISQSIHGLSLGLRHEVKTTGQHKFSVHLDDLELNVPSSTVRERYQPASYYRQTTAIPTPTADVVLRSIGSPLLGRSIFQAGRMIQNQMGIELTPEAEQPAKRIKARP